MMEVPLTIDRVIDRVERSVGDAEIVSRRPDKSLVRTNYRAVMVRARRLAQALVGAGIQRGDCVATLMWNHSEHLEAYFGIPLAGAVMHTLNLRLRADEIAYIANHAGDRFVIVDEVLLPLIEEVVASGGAFERVIVVGNAGERESYESFLEAAVECALPTLAERDGLASCYTSGTTGRPKGVVYSHRSTLLHALTAALPDCFNLSRADTILPVVPMFHVNGWGLPYIAALVGAKLVLPGPHLDSASLLDLMAGEGVTFAAGVPTVWLGIREAIDAEPGRWGLVPGLQMLVGGSAAPEQLIRDFDRLGMTILHVWGMTETSPLGLVARVPPHLAGSDEATRYRLRAKQGAPAPLVDVRVRNAGTDVARDDRTSGELMCRGPWVTGSYVGDVAPERWTTDGFFRTGDVARVDEHGFVQLIDRMADLIKSGGEWIATQELENALMGHAAIREAAVIGVPHPKWVERPLAVYVPRPGAAVSADELRVHLAAKFPKLWLPDHFQAVETIPRTSAGKVMKTELRTRFRDHFAAARAE